MVILGRNWDARGWWRRVYRDARRGLPQAALLITFAATAGSARHALRRPALDAAGKTVSPVL